MLIRAVIVGVNHWSDLTKPFLKGLEEHNPGLDVVILDNGSRPPYPSGVRVDDTVGYGSALNVGAEGAWDWLLCANNDCLCTGNVTEAIAYLNKETVYGNAWKFDYEWMKDLELPAVVDSAYLLIPRRVWDRVGPFDEKMDAAFEEIDYGLRVIDAGFRLDVIELPITHLNLHTRNELEGYIKRWEVTSKAFKAKYEKRLEKGVSHV